jgi:Domain of unknown function (DUF4280)
MSFLVSGTAMLKCSFGIAPPPMTVLPKAQAQVLLPLAGILDNAAIVNVPPFGMCMSLANPTVAAATSAALGVLTPMPCVPALPAPWLPGAPNVLISGAPALTSDCKLMCVYGGMIQIVMPGQTQVQT